MFHFERQLTSAAVVASDVHPRTSESTYVDWMSSWGNDHPMVSVFARNEKARVWLDNANGLLRLA